jgi:hypothetical protein
MAGDIEHAWERSEMLKKFRLVNLKGRDHVEGLGVHIKIILEWILKK